MFYILLENGLPKAVADKNPGFGAQWVPSPTKLKEASGWTSSRNVKCFEDAITLATYLTAFTGETHLPVDEGDGVWPRYRVIAAPCIGDEVSKSFNGDSYPCGKIVKITRTWQITTDTGTKFIRYKGTGGWREAGRGFWMISGVHDERNPHF